MALYVESSVGGEEAYPHYLGCAYCKWPLKMRMATERGSEEERPGRSLVDVCPACGTHDFIRRESWGEAVPDGVRLSNWNPEPVELADGDLAVHSYTRQLNRYPQGRWLGYSCDEPPAFDPDGA